MAGLLGLFGSGARNSPASYMPLPQDPNNPISKAMIIGAMLKDVGGSLRGSGDTDNVMQARMLGYQLQQRAALMKAQQNIARAAAGLPMQEDGDGSPPPQAAPQPPPQAAPQTPDPSLTAPDPNADASVPPPDPGPALTSQVGQDLGGTGGLTPDAQLARYRIAAPQAPAIPPPPVVAQPQAPTQQSLVQSRGPRRPVTMRDMAPAIANMALIPGSEDLVKNDIALFSAADPKVTYDRRGIGTDQYGNPAGGFHPEISADRAPLYDQAGHIVGEQNLIGAPEATAAIAQAKAEAEARTAAKYDLIPVPMSDGSIRLMPRLNARAALVGQGGKPPATVASAPRAGSSVVPADGATPPVLGVTPSPAQTELAKNRAVTQGKNEADISGARLAMQQVDDQTNMIAQNLHDMLGETQDPQTGKWVKTKDSMITGLSTGSGTDLIEHIPFLNQRVKNLRAKIETVRNGTSFNSLQAIKNAMAAAGDGGSGSVRMTDQTARMLGEINGSLDQDQSGPQFEATIRRHLAQLDALNRDRHALFESQYRGVRQSTPGQTGPTANYNTPSAPAQAPANSQAALIAEARRRGLIH